MSTPQHPPETAPGAYPLLLALETSCDDTAAAVLRGPQVLSNVVHRQLDHARYGGILPELAARQHLEQLILVVEAALEQAQLCKQDLEAVAVTEGPGLIGSLHVGVQFAQAFAQARGLPLVGVNHLDGHLISCHLDQPKPLFPLLCLTVSGGHTRLTYAESPLHHRVLAETRDDAAGEAFDKIAKLMGFPYPGGPEIDRWARLGDPRAFDLPKTRLRSGGFSFSGLKTAVRYLLQEKLEADPDFLETHLPDLCASVQAAIVDQLLYQLEQAAQELNCRHIGLAGGVAANSGLRSRLEERAQKLGWILRIAPRPYCTDNAAMIGLQGFYQLQARTTPHREPYLQAYPRG